MWAAAYLQVFAAGKRERLDLRAGRRKPGKSAAGVPTACNNEEAGSWLAGCWYTPPWEADKGTGDWAGHGMPGGAGKLGAQEGKLAAGSRD